ncbi:DNA-directed RNA polymerase subunit alpha [bacterium]|nr:DNA-directed RNA polymerase subunit alpha [bacterium]
MALPITRKEEENPRIVVFRDEKKEGKFFIYPLEPGVGHTIGSALRRVLLSQIEGAAITEARIEGVYHPLSTIPNVLEDVTVILLNLKEVALKPIRPFSGALSMLLDVQGEGEVVAADIKTPPELEIANPEHHIATLTEPDAKLRIEMKVEMGKGFQLASTRESKSQIGFLPLTAIFTPIRKVAYYVENYHFTGWNEGQRYLGQLATKTSLRERLNLERLTIEIMTNGAISPSDALLKAISILSSYFQIVPLSEKKEDVSTVSVSEEAENDPLGIDEDLLDSSLEDLGFPSRAVHALSSEGITKLRDLLRCTEKKLLSLRNLGRKSLEQVKETLNKMGLSLASEEE